MKNFLGLGPNSTGAALFAIFFGTYYGSTILTKNYVMQTPAETEPPKYFREIKVVTAADEDD